MPKKNYTLDKFYYNGITFLNDEQFKKFSMDELNYYSKIFSDILGQVPTDPNGKSFHESYCLCKKKKDGVFSWSSFNDQKRIISTAINAMKNMDRDNFYVGANSYMGKIRERSEKSVFALKNIVIDLDCHNKHSFEDGSYFYQCINKANNFLKELSSQSGIPLPNLVNFTGRGVQIWYFLDYSAVRIPSIRTMIPAIHCSSSAF